MHFSSARDASCNFSIETPKRSSRDYPPISTVLSKRPGNHSPQVDCAIVWALSSSFFKLRIKSPIERFPRIVSCSNSQNIHSGFFPLFALFLSIPLFIPLFFVLLSLAHLMDYFHVRLSPISLYPCPFLPSSVPHAFLSRDACSNRLLLRCSLYLIGICRAIPYFHKCNISIRIHRLRIHRGRVHHRLLDGHLYC